MIIKTLLLILILTFNSFSQEIKLNRDTIAELKLIFASINQFQDGTRKKEALGLLKKIQPYTRKFNKQNEITFTKKQIYKYIIEYPINLNRKKTVRLQDALSVSKIVQSNKDSLYPFSYWLASALIKDYKNLPQVPVDDPKIGDSIKTRERVLNGWIGKLSELNIKEYNSFFEEVIIKCLSYYLSHLAVFDNTLDAKEISEKPLFSIVKKEDKKELEFLDSKIEKKTESKKTNDWKPKEN